MSYRNRTIRRDYGRPFFRRQRGKTRLILGTSTVIAVFLLVIYVQFDQLQYAALEMFGVAPTATPFASDWARQANERFLAGDVEAAAAAYQRAMQQQPDNIVYMYEYGRMLIELGRAPEVLPLGNAAIEQHPGDVRGYAITARAMVRAGDPAGAIPVAQSGLERDPNFAPLYSALSEAYTNIGRYQQGLRFGQQAVDLDPLDAEAHRSFGYAWINVGDRRRAIEHFEIAITIYPNLTSTYFELAFQYKTLGMNEMAVATYNRIIELEPENPRVYLRLCELYAGVGLFTEAQGFCEQAIALNPSYGEAYRELGRMRYNRRNYEGSIESFEQCVAFGAQDIECWYLRGLALYRINRCDEAWDVLNEALIRVQSIPDSALIEQNIRFGLEGITLRCTGFAGVPLPTPIPPTPIPPTPIGS